MASLRARLLTGVLLLSAAGLILLGLVTYAEQRSFLYGRVDQEARAAVPALSQALDAAGYRPATETGQSGLPDSQGGGGFRPGGGPGGLGGRPAINLPPGTYGQRRDASGNVLGHVLIKYSPSEPIPAAPAIPAKIPIGAAFTVGSVGSSGLHYRAYARRDPEDPGITIAAVPLGEVQDTLNRLLLVEVLVIAGVLLALGLTAFFVVRLGLRPLDRMEVTANQIAGGELSRRVSPAEPKTEIGRLGLALNGMLDRLEQAFAERQASEDRLRQFLSDASHELRTPLASIRGYAELFRMGATASRADTELAMRRIEDESRRMGVLVEDLLTLARLDEAPAPRREDVDIATLARDAVTDARATSPQRAITLQAPASAVVSGDPHQLQQVLANLMRNALVHTPADSAIDVTVERSAQEVRVRVRDHGPGLPPGAAEHLFDRFWRAHPGGHPPFGRTGRQAGRERGKGGAGLGLAIVSEIVVAHHGNVSAENAPDGGAIFELVLPVLSGGSQVNATSA
ncbi:MAG TPA: HAMP domain-containing sensor histidine kinase [Solirubrobacteraceae bacterium]|nr:HAMP domain-containing sensor histidine kinase [Solirubrobacteraceae bacterium]